MAILPSLPVADADQRRVQMDEASASGLFRFLATRLAVTGLFLLLMALVAGIYLDRSEGSQTLRHRVMDYAAKPDRYDLVFIGDSRTYCGIHPEYLDPLLGTRSVNIANFAHWFPTQFAMERDLGPSLRGRTVVWTIGHQNFTPINLQPVYPLRLDTAWDLVRLGLTMPGLADTFLQSFTVTRVFSERSKLKAQLQGLLQVPAAPARAGTARPPPDAYVSALSRDQAQAAAASLRFTLKDDPTVASVSDVYDAGALTSLVIYRKGGGYERVEIDHAYFRWQQQRAAPRRMTDAAAAAYSFQADPRMLELFQLMLDDFRRNGVKLIVNEIEEAGFMYPHPAVRAAARRFMQTEVRRRVEAAGFTYVRADLDLLTDSDFFDYNHLNRSGIAKYSPMLAKLLKPIVAAN
jgi:hypothetical protein